MCSLTEAAWNAERTRPSTGRETFLGEEVLSELRPEDGGMFGGGGGAAEWLARRR